MREGGGPGGWQKHASWGKMVVYNTATNRQGACHDVYWAIENRLHCAKGVTLGEDQSTLHTGQGPTVPAFLRDAALSLLRRGASIRLPRLREHAQDPAPAIALVVTPPQTTTRA
jgi:hypothetical protein